MKVLILGANGMFGHVLFDVLSRAGGYDVFGTTRSKHYATQAKKVSSKIISEVDALDFPSVEKALHLIKPDVVVNCIGVIKQQAKGNDPLHLIPTNSLFPHQLNKSCYSIGCKLVHLSTDCVFSGIKGNYSEFDIPDPIDLYGQSKLLGEVTSMNSLSVRTSIIGHELKSKHSLLEWFLSQEGVVKGYTKAIYSGLTTLELSIIFRDKILPKAKYTGLYHIAGQRISKYDLLETIAKVYDMQVHFLKDPSLVIDRSLNGNYFNSLYEYSPPNWDELIKSMRNYDRNEIV